METSFYLCEKCGNLIVKVKDSGIKPFCCGSVMTLLIPEIREEELGEKHIPCCEIKGRKICVKVGETIHPSSEEHRIEWVYLQTDKGGQLRYFKVGEEPVTKFKVQDGEKVEAVYAFCNLHGLWKCDCSKQFEEAQKETVSACDTECDTKHGSECNSEGC
ncbi:MAG: desulfoferrodoxin [Lachnospiraceae bacterium]|nr:desulfoferrodoxin [Lachnospiraceae bacterium]